MFEKKFTERAEKALNLAFSAAGSLGHGYVGSEHLLLGLIREQEGVAAQILAAAGVGYDEVRRRIAEGIGMGNPTVTPRGLTPRTKNILEIAAAEAAALGHNYIGTEHLLLAILREGENVAVRILNAMGADPARLYSDILRALGVDAAPAGGEAGEATAEPGDPKGGI